jgi:chromosome segregation ATPase
MKMELKSLPKFVKFEKKIQDQTDRLRAEISDNETNIAELMKEYTALFAESADTTKISKQLRKLKSETEALRDELNIIKNADFRQKELAHEVLDQFRKLEREVNLERNRLQNEADRLRNETEEKVKNLSEEHAELGNRFNHEVARQFESVIDSLDISDDSKQQMRYQIERGQIAAWAIIK